MFILLHNVISLLAEDWDLYNYVPIEQIEFFILDKLHIGTGVVLDYLIYRFKSSDVKNTWTLLLYSSTKLPSARRNLLSGRTDQFMENTVHGALYL